MLSHNTRKTLIAEAVSKHVPLPVEGFERTKDGIRDGCTDVLATALHHISRHERRRGITLSNQQFSDIIEQVLAQATKEIEKNELRSIDPLDVSAIKEKADMISIRAKRLLLADQFEVNQFSAEPDLVGV